MIILLVVYNLSNQMNTMSYRLSKNFNKYIYIQKSITLKCHSCQITFGFFGVCQKGFKIGVIIYVLKISI